MEEFNNSLSFDRRLYYEDIIGSLAHVNMLQECKILTVQEYEKITVGLNSILKDIEAGTLLIEGDYEDIHSFVESNLIQRIGDTGKKLHTARSRNDQVAVDMRLYAKTMGSKLLSNLIELQDSFLKIAQENKEVLMPGYTHLQRAQVVTFSHHMMAYYSMIERDKKRLINAMEIMDESPLGCCALAGTTYNTNRESTAIKLGFAKPVDNFLDGVSDRDYLIELLSCFSLIMMHLSRFSEELILWSTKEFGFVQLDDKFSTGSSIMPQKKNPDAAELIRGKTGRVYGSLISLLTVMKATPLAYNKDMQEDKEQFFDALDTVLICTKVMSELLCSLQLNKATMFQAVKKGFLNATEAADYLVNKGMAFRDAHGVIGQIVIYSESNEKAIEELTLDELKGFSNYFAEDVYEFIDYRNTLKKGIKTIM
jgi:argininosuccinate lyase